jgi:hypothetical protein
MLKCQYLAIHPSLTSDAKIIDPEFLPTEGEGVAHPWALLPVSGVQWMNTRH